MGTFLTTGLVDEMLAAADTYNLGELYEQQVDENLYNENADCERDAVGLFYDIKHKTFDFFADVTPSSRLKDAYTRQNDVIFIAFVDVDTAVTGSIEDLILDNIE